MKNQIGRSMVEMLGVLAIVGVLSVGAISGYQKAMLKYKLNKQTHQLDTLLGLMTIHKTDWHNTDKQINLIPAYQKLNYIPDGMLKNNNTNYLYDAFNNKITLGTNHCPNGVCQETILAYTIDSANAPYICQNTFQVLETYSEKLLYILLSAPKQSYRYNGDDYCNSYQGCLRDITMTEIYNMCNTCYNGRTCSFNILWSLKQ